MNKIKKKRKSYALAQFTCEQVLGCKWVLPIAATIEAGVCRPGELRRTHPGLTTQFLNDKLRRLLKAKLISREVKPVTPPHVEYLLTERGRDLLKLMSELESLMNDDL